MAFINYVFFNYFSTSYVEVTLRVLKRCTSQIGLLLDLFHVRLLIEVIEVQLDRLFFIPEFTSFLFQLSGYNLILILDSLLQSSIFLYFFLGLYLLQSLILIIFNFLQSLH